MMTRDSYRPLALFHCLFSGLWAGDVARRTAKAVADAHGDAAAVDEVAREIGDNGEDGYDD